MNMAIKYVEECNTVLEIVNIPIDISIEKDSCIICSSKVLNEVKLIEDLFNIENKVIINDDKRLIIIKSTGKRVLDEMIMEEEVEQTITDYKNVYILLSLLKYNSTKFYYEHYHKVNNTISIIYIMYIRT